MKKIICVMVLLAVLFTFFTSCSGYNSIMRDHLQDADNYQTCEVILKDIYYIDPSTNEKNYDITDTVLGDNDIIFEVSFWNSVEELIPFLGVSIDEDADLGIYTFQFHVTKNNSNILLEKGFYTDVTIGEKISVKVSDFLYMDGEFFYIAGVEYDGKEYLSFKAGLENIVDMMNENKSLF